MNEVDKTQKESHVGGQINGLNDELSRLHEGIGSLTDRLGSVLVPERPMGKKEEELESNLVTLANIIRSCKDSVKDASFKIKDLTDRLELP